MLKALYIINAEREARGTLRTPFRFLFMQAKQSCGTESSSRRGENQQKASFFNAKLPQKNKILEILLTL